MQQFFKIATLLLFLGLFIIPKSAYGSSIAKDSCCTSVSSDHEDKKSSKNNDLCHSEGEQGNKTDCNECYSCASAIFFVKFPKSIFPEQVAVISGNSRKIASYPAPQCSKFFSNIWQPPKIA